jgi:diguanylate cyclase (GGDEF)-like protein
MPADLLQQHERFDLRTAEFIDAETERRFRQWQHARAVRQASLALLIAVSLIALFLISDYYLLQTPMQLLYSVIIRGLIVIGGLLTVLLIGRSQSPRFFDRTLLLFQAFSVTLLLYVYLFLKPDAETAVLSLVTLTLGMYLFVPNRFSVATGLGLFLTLSFFALALVTGRIDSLQLIQLGIIVISVNIIGAAFCYRTHLLQRRGFLELMRERYAREALQSEIARRTELEERLLHQAHTDELTGANNRRNFLRLGHDEIVRSLRYGRPLSLLLLDLDHFKTVNDNFGHDAGDEVLRRFSHLCRMTLREPDIFGRLGGEEFAVIIPEEPLEGALQTAERLRGLIEQEFADGPYRLTVSIGVAEMGEQDTSIGDLLKRADTMMYQAKHDGRNRVVGKKRGAA